MNRQLARAQATVMFLVILANFMAQIPYFFHLYYGRQPWLTSLRSILIMAAVLSFFLIASFLLFQGKRGGYPLMIIFLSVEFLFYLWGVVGSVLHGFGLLFQVDNPDLVLRIIYSIGYLNLFASGYWLWLLLRYRAYFESVSARSTVNG